jgi:ABC-type uncharacterized transport system permease subunit
MSELLVIAMLLPLALQIVRPRAAADTAFWFAVLLAVIGPGARAVVSETPHWSTGLADTLWITAAVTAMVFAIVCALSREAWRLGGLVGGYLLVLAAMAALLHPPASASGSRLQFAPLWATAHIAFALLTYGLITLAAIAAFAAFVQESGLKRKRRYPGTRTLPSLTDCDLLQLQLLIAGQAVLAVGLLSGVALEYISTGRLLEFNHKTVFALAAFVLISGLLVARRRLGVRGRRAARMVLLSYLLLTLGYPGVKFVTDVLLAGSTMLPVATVAKQRAAIFLVQWLPSV